MAEKPVDLDRVEAYCDAATEGPWKTSGPDMVICGMGNIAQPCRLDRYHPNGTQATNGQFIANARTDLPALVAELRAAREKIDELVRLIKDHNAVMALVPMAEQPESMPNGLRVLADWFDAVYQDAGSGDEVQQDLRQWATISEKVQNELQTARETIDRLRAELDDQQAAAQVAVVDPLREQVEEANRLIAAAVRLYHGSDRVAWGPALKGGSYGYYLDGRWVGETYEKVIAAEAAREEGSKTYPCAGAQKNCCLAQVENRGDYCERCSFTEA